jgi:hypothetical protein
MRGKPQSAYSFPCIAWEREKLRPNLDDVPTQEKICFQPWDFLASSKSWNQKKQGRPMQTATAPDANSHIPIDTDNIVRGSKLLGDLHDLLRKQGSGLE